MAYSVIQMLSHRCMSAGSPILARFVENGGGNSVILLFNLVTLYFKVSVLHFTCTHYYNNNYLCIITYK